MEDKGMKRIRVYIAGGLGNQLLCYFAGLHLAEVNKKNLVIDDLYASKSHSQNGINSFYLKCAIKNHKFVALKKFEMRIIDSIIYRIPILDRFLTKFGRFKDLHDFELNSKERQIKNIRGFFTSYKYIRSYIYHNGPTLELKNKSQWLINEIPKLRKANPIIIHIRRRDFVQLKNTEGLVSEKYFDTAISKLLSYTSNCNEIWLFSDDYDEICHWKIFKKYSVILKESKNSEIDPAEILYLMSLSNFMIVSNSSFSLVAALINNQNKRVICPSEPFRNGRISHDEMYPADWEKIEVTWTD